MVSYLKSEFYRIFRNKSTYLFIAVCSVLLISANVVLAVVKASEETFPYATTKFSLGLFYSDLSLVFLLCIAVASMIFGNEHSNHTMKNTISYGISRGKIYFGKLIIEVVYSLVAFIIIGGIHIGAAYLLLENSPIENLELLLKACFVALPLFLFTIATSNCFLFIIESTGASISSIVGFLLAIPLVCNLLGMKFTFFAELVKFLPFDMMQKMSFDTVKYQPILHWAGNTGYLNYWLIGIGEMLLMSIIGFLVFRKKEIK